VDDRAEAGLALNDDVRDAHLTAERGEEDNQLDRLDIVGDDDEGCLLRLDEGDAVVEAVLDEERLLVLRQVQMSGTTIMVRATSLVLAVLGGGLSRRLETSLLLLLGLRTILIQQLEELRRGVFVEGVRELGNCGRDLETLREDDLLALLAHVLRPLDETREVSLVLDVLAYDEDVRCRRREERA
jgi:hypothetical protein